MKKTSNRKGQFSIIAAALTAIVLVTAIITTYSILQNTPIQDRPQILSAIEATNSAIDRILKFVVAYYGSIMQVTGNTSYAKNLVSEYLQSSLENFVHTHPDWSPSFPVADLSVNANWFNITSSSEGSINMTYSLIGLGIYDLRYSASAALDVTVNPSSTSYVMVNITRNKDEPYPTLTRTNFLFYNYSYEESDWDLTAPIQEINSVESTEQSSTYNITVPSGIDPSSYLLQVVDTRGITVAASTYTGITYDFSWNQTLYSNLTCDTLVMEALQNGTLRWLGQNLQLTTSGKPIPPIPVRGIHLNATVNGQSREIPFQIENWESNYRIPGGLASNASIFSSREMTVFLVNHQVESVVLWWDGRDVAKQTSYAWRNIYFNDDPNAGSGYGILDNGVVALKVYHSGFSVESSAVSGSTISNAQFLRVNGEDPTYGAAPAYVIYNGVVRDIVQQEAEWSSGSPGCPNFYSQIVLTLPANASYYTYALRTIFVDSAQTRTLTDLSPIQLSNEWATGQLTALTENGTSSGYPISAETYPGDTDLFYDFSFSTGWTHHWSEYIAGSRGAGIMYTDSANLGLYSFDSIAGDKTGALSVTANQRIAWRTPTSIHNKSGESNPYLATNAIDGSTSSSWRHYVTGDHWIVFDLGETTNISRVRIYQQYEDWGGSQGIEVYASDDPESWGTAVWSGIVSGYGWEETGQFTASGRYVKLVSLSSSSSQRMYEVQVETVERRVLIEMNPVEIVPASFQYALDLTWHGAVVNFDGTDPIYSDSGDHFGLWVIVESPPTGAVS